MMLSPANIEGLDALARTWAARGKNRAANAYTRHATRLGWFDTPRWVTGRNVFNARWREYRAAYLAQQAAA